MGQRYHEEKVAMVSVSFEDLVVLDLETADQMGGGQEQGIDQAEVELPRKAGTVEEN